VATRDLLLLGINRRLKTGLNEYHQLLFALVMGRSALGQALLFLGF